MATKDILAIVTTLLTTAVTIIKIVKDSKED